MQFITEGFTDLWVFDARDFKWSFKSSVSGFFEEIDLVFFTIVNPAETGAIAEGPVDGGGGELEDFFEFVHELKRRT